MSYDPLSGEVMEPRRNLPAETEPPRVRNLIFASPSCSEVFGALCDFQAKCEPPKKTKTATVKGTTKAGKEYSYEYQYAPLDEIHNAIREPMAAAGLAYRQFLATMGDQWVMRTIVAHRSGEWTGCDYPIYIGEQRGQAQAFASGVTYARRYGLMLALGIVAEDDDDANVADAQPATISGENRSGARTAPRPAPGSNGAAPRQQAAPAPSGAAAEATKRWKEIAADIDIMEDTEMLMRLEEWPAFQSLERIYREAAPDAYQEGMDMLRTRAAKRRERLVGSLEPFDR